MINIYPQQYEFFLELKESINLQYYISIKLSSFLQGIMYLCITMLNLQICHHEIFMESNQTNKLYQIINQYTTYAFSCHIGFSYNVPYSNATSDLTSRHNHIKATETRNVEVNKKDVQKDITCCILICLGILYLQ